MAKETTESGDQILEAIRLLVQQNQLSSESLTATMGTVIPQAIAEANMKSRQWWDDRNFNHKSPLNPEGDLVRPKPVLVRQIFWVGFPCQEEELHRDEIDLLNRLTPGQFHMHNRQTGEVERHNYFIVRDLDPGVPNGRLLVGFPCASVDERANLARYDQGRGMVDLLLEMVPEARAQYKQTVAA